MKSIVKRMAMATGSVALSLGLVGVTATPAHASVISDSCHRSATETSGGGWCSGNGPHWTYIGSVYCENGVWYRGVEHWFGDVRGSYKSCPLGLRAQQASIEGFLDGVSKGALFTDWRP